MSKPFHERRRQGFLTEKFYSSMEAVKQNNIRDYGIALHNSDNDANDRRRLSWGIADDAYELLSLHYTAGEPIEPLRDELETVVRAYDRYTELRRTYEEDPQHPPLYFAEIDEYERCLQLIGLCYLLHRRDLLPRIAAWQDPNYFGHDAVYEELLEYGLADRYDTDKVFHRKPYEWLIKAMYADSDAESADAVGAYCKAWFPALKDAPWHNGHLRMTNTDGDYFGYWAFEAGAVAYLLELDDTGIDHMVYPRDLVAWARANKYLSDEPVQQAGAYRGRCDAGQPCPKEGYWFTPAKRGSRRRFKAGEIMPDLGSKTWACIWQWDDNQT